jgi:hypothetical protein
LISALLVLARAPKLLFFRQNPETTEELNAVFACAGYGAKIIRQLKESISGKGRPEMTSHIIKQLRGLNTFLPAALACSLSLAFVGCESREAAATATEPVRAELNVESFWPVTGTGFVMARAYGKNESGFLDKIESGSYGERSRPTHNLLFAGIDDMSGRWLLPHNRFLIWNTQELPPAEDNRSVAVYKMTIPEERVARWIYIEVDKSDTNNNEKWDDEDRKAIAIADPSGLNYVEVITDIDEISQRTMHSEDKLTVIYKSNNKHFIANIDLPQRQVTTKDLPAIP